ncbi:hypothetical protein WJX73_008796 [Symbiochloris irregularis]|uniref:Glycoside hydrolase family 5 domain-containing protein n=1 Tax=Symbiochloris irregularis TaxID=706552 RepID=A0AAW1NT21_9CHLO
MIVAASLLMSACVEDYPIPQLAGHCSVKLFAEQALLSADELPLNETAEQPRPVSLHFAVVSTDWAPVRAPWVVSLVNPGYVDAAVYTDFELAAPVDYGTVSLMTTRPDQQLLPHGGNQIEVQVTVNVSTAYAMPYTVLLDNAPCSLEAVDEAGLLQDQVTQQPLTTKDGQIIGLHGEVIDLKGVAWFGFDDNNTMLDGLWEPEVEVSYSGLSMELQTVVQRIQLLGFNAVRLPFTFTDLRNTSAINYTLPCEHPPLTEVLASVVPPYMEAMITNETLQGGMDVAELHLRQPYPLEEGVCNAWMADMPSVLDRFKFVVNYLTHNGFYVAVVQQTNNEPTLAKQQLLIFDALYEVNPHMLFFVQGTGQKAGGLVANYGDGLATSLGVLKSFDPPLSDPNPFFRQLLKRPYLNQVVIAPHVYPPSISLVEGGPTTLGSTLYKRLSESFGYLNDKGYCVGTFCHKFPVLLGEFGSGFDTLVDIDFMDDLAMYMHNTGQANDGQHNRIGSYFLWAWNANAALQLGLLEEDWQTIKWRYVDYLHYLGLHPWYASDFQQEVTVAGDEVSSLVLEPQPVITIPAPPPPLPCPDVAPDSQYTCAEQKKFGKCSASFLADKGYCAATCGRCWSYQYPPPGPQCPDIAPDSTYTCAQQASFGKCNQSWMIPAPTAADIHSGVNVAADASQAQLQAASGAGAALTSAAG